MLKLKRYFLLAIVLFITLFLFIYSSDVRVGVCNGIDMCLNILIPSLFPFMFVSVFLAKTGLGDDLGRLFGKLTNILFKLPSCCSSAILMSTIGGYPTGASSVKTLFDEKKINEEQAERMAYFCVGSGPAYVVNIVGISIFNSFRLGLLLFIAQFLSLILLGLLLNIRVRCILSNEQKVEQKLQLDLSDKFIDSCRDSLISMINICSFVILFSALISMVDACGAYNFTVNILNHIGIPKSISMLALPVVLEVTNATSTAGILRISPVIFAFFIAFGGLCVHFQIFSVLGIININKIRFFLIRILQAF